MDKANSTKRGPRFIDLTGQRFGHWTVIDEAVGHVPRKCYWNCVCDCGTHSKVPGPALRIGRSKCCTHCRVKTHGMSRTPEHVAWLAMRGRCRRVTSDAYHNYGGRGIAVCDEWESFETFYRDMGSRPSPKHTIERLDNNSGYSKNNCVWATRATQLRNTRRTRLVTFNGITQCIVDWAKQLGIPSKTLYNRLARGCPIADALTATRITSKDSKGARKITFNGVTMCLAEWARAIGIHRGTLCERLAKWPLHLALTAPPHSTRKKRMT